MFHAGIVFSNSMLRDWRLFCPAAKLNCVFFDHVAHTGRNGCIRRCLYYSGPMPRPTESKQCSRARMAPRLFPFCGVIDAGEHVVIARLQLIAFTANEVGVARLHIIVQSGKEVISIAAITFPVSTLALPLWADCFTEDKARPSGQYLIVVSQGMAVGGLWADRILQTHGHGCPAWVGVFCPMETDDCPAAIFLLPAEKL